MKTWLQTLAAAAAGGAFTSAAEYISTAGPISLRQAGSKALVGALLTAGAFLLKSPIRAQAPKEETKK